MTAVNYMYRLADTNRDLLVFHDLGSVDNVACIYTLTSTIPPHNPTDHMPEMKYMFWYENEKTDRLFDQTHKLHAGHVVVYLNYNKTPMDRIVECIRQYKFDMVCTSSEVLYYADQVQSLEATTLLRYTPLIAGVPQTLMNTGGRREEVYRGVFAQRFKPFIHAKETPTRSYHLGSVYKKLDAALSPLGVPRTQYVPCCEDKEPRRRLTAYAVVYGDDHSTLLVFAGYAYMTDRDELVNLYPEHFVKKCMLLPIEFDMVFE